MVKYIKSFSPVKKFTQVFIVMMLLFVLLGKLFFSASDWSTFLFAYGVLVTLIIWMTFFVAFIFYKDPYEVIIKNKDLKSTKNYKVSCMVAVRNEEVNISRCLDSMLRQTYQNKEIIVVNDASTDGTLEILKKYESEGKIILIDLKTNLGKKKALAKAMFMAKGEIFAHTDSDSLWAHDAIEKMVTIFEHYPLVGAISGHGRALNGDKNLLTKVQDSWMEGQFSIRKAFESVFGAVTCVSGPLAVFRKEAIFNFIPAWEHDKFLGSEFKFATDRMMTGFVLGSIAVGSKVVEKYKDSEFVEQRYPFRDWKIVYCKSAKSWTIVPDTFRMFIKQQVRWKKSFIRNMFFTGLFYWKKPLPTAIVYYSHILLVIMGPFVSFKHLVYLPLNGNWLSAVLYLSGILFVGFMFGLACKMEDQYSHKWIYRPLMSLLSTLVISWLIFYSLITIKKMVWART